MNIVRIINDGIVILPMSLEHQRLWRSLQQRMFLLQLNHTNCKQMGHNLIFYFTIFFQCCYCVFTYCNEGTQLNS